MKTLAKIENGQLIFRNQAEYSEYLKRNEGKEIQVDLHLHRDRRTDRQNRALHLWFTMLAEALNDAGYDMKKVIRANMDIPWTDYNVKEFLWRPVQEAQLGKKSTTQLTTDEIDKVFEVINKAVGERTGVHVPFPSIETMYEE